MKIDFDTINYFLHKSNRAEKEKARTPERSENQETELLCAAENLTAHRRTCCQGRGGEVSREGDRRTF